VDRPGAVYDCPMDTTTTLPTPIHSGYTAKILDLNPDTVKAQSSIVWDEIAQKTEWLSTAEAGEIRVLWIRLADGRGIGIQEWGQAVAVSPGFFSPSDELLTYGFVGAEFVNIHSEEPEKLVARVIRRARKLEIKL